MRKLPLAALLIAVLHLAACKKENSCDCFKSTGDIVSESRTIEPFTEIILNDNINLFLTYDSLTSVRVEAGENLLPLIRTDWDNGSLSVYNDNKCNFVRSFRPEINVYITMPLLTHIFYEGSGNITCLSMFECDSITLDCWDGSGSLNLSVNCNTSHLNVHTGVADIQVWGSSGVSYIHYNGNGPLHAENLNTGYSFVNNKGTGDLYIRAEKQIGYTLSWTGSIFYYGDPLTLSGADTGEGELIRAGN